MISEIASNETKEIRNPSLENYKNIKPEVNISPKEVDDFWRSEFKKESEKVNEFHEDYKPIIKESKEAIKNKIDGCAREKEVGQELEQRYPLEKGYQIESEALLRNKDGDIVKDPVTGEARRVDFMVVKDGIVVDSIEVTSMTANKTEQIAKEQRIRDVGGNYIRKDDKSLVEIPSTVHTRIERRN